MYYFIYSIFLLFVSSLFFPLFSAEVLLKDGRGYICEIVSESNSSIVILLEDKEYEIPRSEILAVHSEIKGKHRTISYSIFYLKDKSQIIGKIARETDDIVAVETKMGFVAVPKKEIETRNDPPTNSEPNPSWSADFHSAKSRIGVSGSILSHQSSLPENSTNPTMFGLFWEPYFSKFGNSWRMGTGLDYLSTKGDFSRYEFWNFSTYLQKNWKSESNPILDFYANFGPGISQLTYTSFGRTYYSTNPDTQALLLFLQREEKSTGYNPFLGLELGWQGLQTGRFTHRLSLRGLYFSNQGETVPFLGIQYSVVYHL